jgi:hypothetical protein
MNINDYQQKINDIAFINCIDIKMGDVLHYYLKSEINIKDVCRALKSVFFVDNYKFSVSGNPNILCLCSSDYNFRPEHKKAFNNVMALIDDKIVMMSEKKIFSIFIIRNINFIIKWYKQLKKIEKDSKKRMYYSLKILSIYRTYQSWEKLLKEKKWNINSFLTYCDVMPVDNFFTQKFNMNKKNTITLQHGTFNIINNSWAYLGSKSKYFLAESQAAKNTAISVGYNGKMIVVGSPHHLNEIKKNINREKDSIGIVMNSPMQPVEDNIEMLKELLKYCEKNNKNMFVKLHPADDNSKYNNILLNKNVHIYGKEISIDDFCNMVEIVIVSSSTSFLTALRLNIPCFLFVRENHDINLFEKTDYLKFTNIEELENKIIKIGSDEYKNEVKLIREYLIGSSDLKKQYKNIIKSIQKDKCLLGS